MAFKVFLSYSGTDDQVIALRLQTLAAVYGFSGYVPSADTRRRPGSLLRQDVRQSIDGCDLFLAVVTQSPSPAAVQEVEYARGREKLIIPIVGPWVDRSFLEPFPNAFFIDPADPSRVESEIVQFLKKSRTKKENTGLLIGLTALAVGLLVLSASE